MVGDAIGANRVCEIEPWMASESMSSTLKLFPGVFALVGIANPEVGSGAAHHNDKFDLDEAVLKYGVAGACAYAFGFLESDIDTSKTRFDGTVYDLYKMAGYGEDRLSVLRK